MHRVILSQEQDFAFPVVELDEVPAGPFIPRRLRKAALLGGLSAAPAHFGSSGSFQSSPSCPFVWYIHISLSVRGRCSVTLTALIGLANAVEIRGEKKVVELFHVSFGCPAEGDT